jgi:hypothetical protein
MNTSSFLSRFESFPERIQKQIIAYAESVLKKQSSGKTKKGFAFDWEGGLSELSGNYTSVELQHKANEWR